jgi:EAL domain-containing protein (putative c-di-GMP-specific phosphodiesterase class I)
LEDEQLIKLADTAMYHAKSSGKNTYQFFTDDMHKRAQKRLEVEQEVSQALKNKEFVLVYLPKYDLAQNKIESYEALLRWQHPQKGLLTPISFLRSLEEMGLGGQVGEWVIHQACEQMAANPELNISINVFAKQYRDGDLLEVVEAALTKTAIEPSRLTLEISEQLIMADTGFAFACIADLKALGVRIALDDYANSVSSIAYLNRLPIDEVKIDRQYIEQIDRAPHTLRMVKGMVALAQNLELKVAVEGVERESQLDLLKAMQCDLVQGFYFSKPLFLEEL